MHSEHDYRKIHCPQCNDEITIEFGTARCTNCGWWAADADLDEILDDT